jgi:cytochrome b subunit of formate dehydrogenase
MSPAQVRRTGHAVHAVTTLVLIATGLLIEWPELRARLFGGYGLQLSAVHHWAGALFALAPMLAAAIAARPLARDLRRRLGPPDPVSWKKIHIVATLVLTVLLAGTGALLWIDPGVPIAVFDATVQVHVISTWGIIASLPIHLTAARRKIADVVAVALGLRGLPALEFPLDDEESEDRWS